MKYWAIALLLVAAAVAYLSFPQRPQSEPPVQGPEPAIQTAEKQVSENVKTPKNELSIKPQEKTISENPIMKVANFKLKIEYCTSWGYLAKADSLSAAVQKQYGVKAELVKSSGGVFEVYKDDKLIFSKKQTQRFPTNEEILKALTFQ